MGQCLQCPGRFHEHAGSAARIRIVPDQRINAANLGKARTNHRAESALQGREAERLTSVLRLVPQYELHTPGAESAVTVVEQHRSVAENVVFTARTRGLD